MVTVFQQKIDNLSLLDGLYVEQVKVLVPATVQQ